MSTHEPPGAAPPPPPPDRPLVPPPPPKRGAGTLTGILIGVVVFALVAAGVVALVSMRDDGGSTTKPTKASAIPKGSMPSTDPDLKTFYDQKLGWRACGKNQCAALTVPLDYAQPDGKTIKVNVIKVPATGKRIGSLVVNPGGPGGSGIDYAKAGSGAFTEPVLEHYDIVGFDPRGVASSTPLDCLTTAQQDAYNAQDPDPDTAAERARYAQNITDFGQACLKKSPDIVRHMSTQEVVRDMDVLRQTLGEAKLTYLGASYGTTIGAQYANLFPTHVGRMVLDGAIDQSLTNEQVNLGQAKGFQTATRAYVQSCISQGNCPLGSDVDQALDRIKDLVAKADADPLPTNSNGRRLTGGLALTGVLGAMYVKEYWPVLTQAFSQALGDGNGQLLLTLSDSYTERGPSGYAGNLLQALQAVNCLDDSQSVPVQDIPKYVPEFEKASPTFGEAFAYALTSCNTWPVKSKTDEHPVTGKGAPPIVVIGTTRDPATPYAWAKALAKELDSGVLVSRDGDGHTGYNRGSSCVDSAVEGYLLRGKVPKDGTRCS